MKRRILMRDLHCSKRTPSAQSARSLQKLSGCVSSIFGLVPPFISTLIEKLSSLHIANLLSACFARLHLPCLRLNTIGILGRGILASLAVLTTARMYFHFLCFPNCCRMLRICHLCPQEVRDVLA